MVPVFNHVLFINASFASGKMFSAASIARRGYYLISICAIDHSGSAYDKSARRLRLENPFLIPTSDRFCSLNAGDRLADRCADGYPIAILRDAFSQAAASSPCWSSMSLRLDLSRLFLLPPSWVFSPELLGPLIGWVRCSYLLIVGLIKFA